MTHIRDEHSRSLAESLRAGGHQITTCDSPDGHGPMACAALRGEPCPIETRPVDVALHVTTELAGTPSIEDEGILCALRQFIPLVVANYDTADPASTGDGFAPWAAAVCAPADVEKTLAWAAAAPLRIHIAAAAEAANAVLASKGVEAHFDAIVHRSNGQIQVGLEADGPVPDDVRRDAAVRAHDVIRQIDQRSPAVDVSATAPPE